MKKISLALDWTPNTNHIGFYVGLAKGWYKEKGIDLHIETPSDDYSKSDTPGRKLVNDVVDFCICPSETLVSCWTTEPGKIRPIAVAAVLADDTSAIVAKSSSGIKSLQDLDGKTYASYEGRFEMAIVKQMVKSAGGRGDVIELTPPKLACFDAVLHEEAIATWIFMGWEGLMVKEVELATFPVSKSGVPYGYSPLLLANPRILNDKDTVQNFLKVTSDGYKFACENPQEAAFALLNVSNHPSLQVLGIDFILKSIEYLVAGNHYINTSEGKWGVMAKDKWESYIQWLLSNNLLTHRDGSQVVENQLPVDDLFTNDYL